MGIKLTDKSGSASLSIVLIYSSRVLLLWLFKPIIELRRGGSEEAILSHPSTHIRWQLHPIKK